MTSSLGTPAKPAGVSLEHWAWVRDLLQNELFQGSPQKEQRRGWIAAFGSRVTGHYRKDSDLDLYIEMMPPLTRAELAALNGALEESALPFKVDLIDASLVPSDITSSILSLPRVELLRR